MTLLFVDHEDSFSQNLISQIHFCLLKEKRHQKIQVISSSHLSQMTPLLKNLKGVIFSPGPYHPKDYPDSCEFLMKLNDNIPFLGICLGHQILLHINGMSIEKLQEKPKHGEQIFLEFLPSCYLKNLNDCNGKYVLFNSLGCVSLQKNKNQYFRVLSKTSTQIMMVEHIQKKQFGIQFHPESFASTRGEFLIEKFLSVLEW